MDLPSSFVDVEKHIVKLLHDSLNGINIKAKTAELLQISHVPGYGIVLLNVINSASVSYEIRHAAAIQFKNYILNNWVYEDEDEGTAVIITENDRNLIKNNLVTLMVSSPQKLQVQLGQALTIISKYDFPVKWPALLAELISKLNTLENDIHALNGVLETLHSIFYRYRHEVESNSLWQEIAYVLEHITTPLTALWQQTLQLLFNHINKNGTSILPEIMNVLGLQLDIFFSLNSQDIPSFYEENIAVYFQTFLQLLKLQSTIDENGLLVEQVKALICDIVNLYTMKYEEQFKSYVATFVNEIWQILTTIDEKKRYDVLFTSAMKFLTSVVKKEANKELFDSEDALKNIAEKVIIPQLKLRNNNNNNTDDEELYEDIVEYIRRDIECGDADTRRCATVTFVRALCIFFEAPLTAILKSYVNILLQEYQSAPEQKWINKDCAMYIILALSVRGKTAAKGVTQTNPYIDVGSFFSVHVVDELNHAHDVDDLPILKVDCLKFIAAFRHQIPAESFSTLMPILIRYLAASKYAVYTHASYTVERLLSVKENAGGITLRYHKATIQPFLQQLLIGLFNALDQEESQENEYIMKAIMRVCSIGQDSMLSFVTMIIQKITTKLAYVSQNPKQPHFNHYLFETLACLILHLCKADSNLVSSFENALFPPFHTMLGMETCLEFGPYVFQILAQLLEFHTDIPASYQSIFPSLLTPVLWENNGNIPALVRLLTAYLMKKGATTQNNHHLLSETRLDGLLGVFQKLLTKKSTQIYGMELLDAVFDFIPLNMFVQYLPQILQLIFARLRPDATPTSCFILRFIISLSIFTGKHTLTPIIQAIDSFQPGLFANVYEKIILHNVALLCKTDWERKMVIIGITNMWLCTPQIMLTDTYIRHFAPSMVAIISLIEYKTTTTIQSTPGRRYGAPKRDQMEVANEEQDETNDNNAFSTTYIKLSFAPIPEYDPYKCVSNVSEYFVSLFSRLLGGENSAGTFAALFQQQLLLVVQPQKSLVQDFFIRNKITL